MLLELVHPFDRLKEAAVMMCRRFLTYSGILPEERKSEDLSLVALRLDHLFRNFSADCQ
jgi:hypothetical protein